MPNCTDCHGTGADARKTAAARANGSIDRHSHIRCWTCIGNGLAPIHPGRAKPIRPAITVARGNDLHFPGGNENGDAYEPLWIAKCGSVGYSHGRTPFLAMLGCARQVRTYRNRNAGVAA